VKLSASAIVFQLKVVGTATPVAVSAGDYNVGVDGEVFVFTGLLLSFLHGLKMKILNNKKIRIFFITHPDK
jgi:hypothetical protein